MNKGWQGLLILFVLSAGVGILYTQAKPPCMSPITYSIGSIDPRFDITTDALIQQIRSTENIWEKAADRDLFAYDANSSFKINLIYDERQARTDEMEEISNDLETTHQEFDSLDAEAKALIRQYDTKRAAYESANGAFKRDLEAYNSEVDRWNREGGAPVGEYEKLQSRKAALNTRSAELNKQRVALNDLAEQINKIADIGQSIAEDYNSTVSTYNERFGTSTVFDQGVYNNKEINIYQFRGLKDLELVITHELGHAIGLDHVDDPKSIMHYLIKDQNLKNITLGNADVAELQVACRLR